MEKYELKFIDYVIFYEDVARNYVQTIMGDKAIYLGQAPQKGKDGESLWLFRIIEREALGYRLLLYDEDGVCKACFNHNPAFGEDMYMYNLEFTKDIEKELVNYN